MSEKLKPCPFCGCDELTVLRSNQIECDLCLALAAHDKQWNSRPAEQALAEKDAEIERLTALVGEMEARIHKAFLCWDEITDEAYLSEAHAHDAVMEFSMQMKSLLLLPTSTGGK